MRLRDLPGYPSVYLDLVEDGLRTLDSIRLRASEAGRAAVDRMGLAAALARQAEEAAAGPNARRSLAAIARPGSLVVTAEVRPALFGGTLSQMLTCLTAIRLAQDLGREGYAAIPLVCVDSRSFPGAEAYFLDPEGRIVALSDTLATESTLSSDGLTDEIAAIYSLEQSNPESLKMLRYAYSVGITVELATRRLLADLLEPWGALVADGSDPALAHIWPAAAVRVVGPDTAIPLFPGRHDGTRSLWPSFSVTLVDIRSRKTMDRYGFSLLDVFLGKEALLGRIEGELGQEQVLGRFGRAVAQIEAGLGEVAALVPSGDALHKAVGEAQDRMNYQLEKVRERYSAAVATRRDAAARQLERLCNSVAPAGRPQELHLAATHFVLRYSRAVLAEILHKADPFNISHQQIALE